MDLGEDLYERFFRTMKYGGWTICVQCVIPEDKTVGGVFAVVATFNRKENLLGETVEWQDRILYSSKSKNRAITWLARLPEDDPPDFSTMGLEVE